MKLITLFLTCADQAEATKITRALLEKRLAACIKQMPVHSTFHWEGEIQESDEVLLLIESAEEKFDAINKVVEQLHSYKEYVLTAVPIVKTTPGVMQWVKEVCDIA